MHKQNKLFLLMISFFILATQMFGPIYAIFVKEIGGDILEAGTAWAIFLLVSGFGIFIMGKVEDRIKKDKMFMLIGSVLTCIGLLGYFFVSNIAQLFFVQVIMGFAVMVITPARDSFYTHYLEKGKFASEWAAWESSWYIMGGIAAVLGAFIANRFGFKTLFLVMFAMSLIGLVITTQLKEKK